jgi:hypothetical protein
MTRALWIPCLFAAGVCLSSCNRHIYVPNTVNAPLLKEKYEFKGSLSPTNYQLAFAVANKVAIMANGQYVYRLDLDNDNTPDNNDIFLDEHTRGGVFEGAVGFFQPLDLKKRMVFDTYAGFGAGRFKTLDGAYNSDGSRGNVGDYQLTTRFSKFFVQPSIGFVHPVFEAVFSSRVSVVNFYGMSLGSKVFENEISRRDDFLRISDNAHTFIEPAFTFRVGYKYVKFQTQLLFSLLLDDDTYSGYDVNDYFQPVAVGIGVSFNIGQWYNKQ